MQNSHVSQPVCLPPRSLTPFTGRPEHAPLVGSGSPCEHLVSVCPTQPTVSQQLPFLGKSVSQQLPFLSQSVNNCLSSVSQSTTAFPSVSQSTTAFPQSVSQQLPFLQSVSQQLPFLSQSVNNCLSFSQQLPFLQSTTAFPSVNNCLSSVNNWNNNPVNGVFRSKIHNRNPFQTIYHVCQRQCMVIRIAPLAHHWSWKTGRVRPHSILTQWVWRPHTTTVRGKARCTTRDAGEIKYIFSDCYVRQCRMWCTCW